MAPGFMYIAPLIFLFPSVEQQNFYGAGRRCLLPRKVASQHLLRLASMCPGSMLDYYLLWLASMCPCSIYLRHSYPNLVPYHLHVSVWCRDGSVWCSQFPAVLITHYIRIALHRRFKTPHHYQISNWHNHTGSDEGKLSLSVSTNR